MIARVVAILVLSASIAEAQAHTPAVLSGPTADVMPAALQGVGLDQRLDQPLPLDVLVQTSGGEDVPLRHFFGGRPVLLSFVYLDCPLLCSQVLGGVVRGLRPLRLEAGRDFSILALSFHPGDTPAKAAEARARVVADYGRTRGGDGIDLVTARASAIDAVTSAAGFSYRYNARTGQYQHPAVLLVLTPDGRVSRYLPGIEYAPRDLQLALVEASSGAIGSFTDRLLLYCYQYDPSTGRYSLLTLRVLRAGGLLTVAALGLLIGRTWWREGRRRRPGGGA